MTAVLERQLFTTNRTLEFFSEKELQIQIGYSRALWPAALVKELIDNALDACEQSDRAPEIEIVVEPDAVSVRDNGPGLPLLTLQRSLDFLVRASDKAYYVSPSRGQLGNALKCVWAAPFVVDGEHGRVEVLTGGQTHQIDVTLDRIAQQPRLNLSTGPDGVVKTGALVRMHWSGIAKLSGRGRTEGFLQRLLDADPGTECAGVDPELRDFQSTRSLYADIPRRADGVSTDRARMGEVAPQEPDISALV